MLQTSLVKPDLSKKHKGGTELRCNDVRSEIHVKIAFLWYTYLASNQTATRSHVEAANYLHTVTEFYSNHAPRSKQLVYISPMYISLVNYG